MTYSCGVFERRRNPARGAVRQVRAHLPQLRLSPQRPPRRDRHGLGWTRDPCASRYGCHVTTTTISREQHDWAKEKIAAAGLSNRVTLLLDDYRDLHGRYDKLVSIEMIEAVARATSTPTRPQCSRLLEPHGAMLLQAITIPGPGLRGSAQVRGLHPALIFPGSFIPSVSAITSPCAARPT